MQIWDCQSLARGDQEPSPRAVGYLWAGGSHYRDVEVARYFAGATSWAHFLRLADEASGEWSIVMARDGEVWMAVDARASQRIYYCESDGRLMVSDNGFDLVDRNEVSWDEDACLFFLRWGFAPRERTLVSGISRLPAQHALRYAGVRGTTLTAYTDIRRVEMGATLSYAEARDLLRQHLDEAGERLVRHLGGRTAILPLTGGYDSRMIAYQLDRLGYDNVLAINYGRRANEDALRGAEVARRLGMEYQFVESTSPEAMDYTRDADWHAYMRSMTGLSSCYYYQEYRPASTVAARVPGGVVLPGHQGDDLGGSQLTHTRLGRRTMSSQELAQYLYDHQVMHQRFDREQRMRLVELHRSIVEGYPEGLRPWQMVELFMQRERISKYNLNSQASWRYFGLETAGLFLDKALAEFAYGLPWEYRYGKRLHEDVVREMFASRGILFPEDGRLIDRLTAPSYRLRQWVKSALGGWRPQRDLFAGDLIGFRELMQPVLEEVRRDGRFAPLTTNGLSFAWYLIEMERYLGQELPRALWK